jgi:hypothetical protein
MPQVDTATFLPIIFWTFVIYVVGFLLLNTASLFTLLSGLKLAVKRAVRTFSFALSSRRSLSNVLLFPWIAL